MKKTMTTKWMGILTALALLLTAVPALGEQTTDDATAVHPTYEWALLESEVSIRIGQDGQSEYAIDMYDHDATMTMLNYLSATAMLFPTYTYEEEAGFVAHNIRGDYSRDAETTVADIHAGELYLFSGNQLRLYLKDVPDANITATPVGYVTDTETLADDVHNAYTGNLGDMWGVDVYFWITRIGE